MDFVNLTKTHEKKRKEKKKKTCSETMNMMSMNVITTLIKE